METRVSFPEAVARSGNGAWRCRRVKPEPPVTSSAARRLYDVMESGGEKFFADTLASRDGATARAISATAHHARDQCQFRPGLARLIVSR